MEHRVRQVIALAEESLHKGWSPARVAVDEASNPPRLKQTTKNRPQ